jgi:hypothetical protein
VTIPEIAAILAMGVTAAQPGRTRFGHSVAAKSQACFENFGMIKRGKADKQAARKVRLSAALRENLKRRKQQARDRAAAGERHESPHQDAPAKPAQEPGSVPGFCHNRSDD